MERKQKREEGNHKEERKRKRVRFEEGTRGEGRDRPVPRSVKEHLVKQELDAQEGLPEDKDLLRKAREARSARKRHQTTLATGLEEEEEEDDKELEDLGESNPTEEDVENLFQQGVNLEAFNMKEELAEGVVDVDSGAVNPRKARELPDEAWLVEFDEHMKDRQYAHRHNRYSKSRGEQSNEAPTAEEVDKIQLLNEIANTLLWGEKVDTAMRRLRPNGKKPRPKPLPTGDPSDPPPPPPLTFNEFLERLDKVVGAGVTSIYSMTKEEVLDLLDEETNPKSPEADKENVPGKADADGLSWGVTPTLWDYKWSDRTDQTVYGPHTSIEMDSWIKQGYFDESVLCRQTGTQDEFRNIKEVDFSLYN